MRKIHRLYLLVLSLLIAGSAAFVGLGINAGETPRKIRVIYSNDTLGNLAPCG